VAVLSSVIGRGTLAARPAAGAAGRLYFATDGSGTMYRDNGSSWDSVETSASGMTNPMTTAGDIIYGGASGTPTRLAIGTAGQVLKVNAGATAPEWGSASGGGGLYPIDEYSIDATNGDHFTAASLGASWTRRNFVSGDEAYQQGVDATYLRLSIASRARGDGYFRTVPAGDWTFAMAYILRGFANASAWGISVVDTNGTGVGTCIYNDPQAPILVQITTYSTYGGSFVQPAGVMSEYPNLHKFWVKLRKNGTNYYIAYSLDGEVWSPESSALAWAGTPDRVAMMLYPLGADNGTAWIDVDWFNKIA